MNYEMELEEFTFLYNKLYLNYVLAEICEIEYYDEIGKFLNDAVNNVDDETESKGNNKKRALIKFFNSNKENIGFKGNIFLERSGSDIYCELQKYYEEALNENDNDEY